MDELVKIPLLEKELSDSKHFKIIILLIVVIILTNIAWSSTWLYRGSVSNCNCQSCNTTTDKEQNNYDGSSSENGKR